MASGIEIHMYLEVGMTQFYHLALMTLVLVLSMYTGPE